MLRTTALMAVFLLASIHPFASAQAAPVAGRVTIKVLDPTGAPIPHARMRIVPYPLALSLKLETSSEGVVDVPLSPGPYEIFVQANGFKPASQKFEVAANTSQMVTFALRLGEGSLVFLTSTRSPDEQEVWQLENALWKYVADLDVRNYEASWAKDAVALRQEGYYLFGQKDVATEI